MHLNLSTLAIFLGLVVILCNFYGIIKPHEFGKALRRFPRFTPLGYPLMLLATGWFLYYLNLESVSDFTSFKPLLYAIFGAVGIGACFFVRDYLPVRGLAVTLLVAAKLMVDTARWVDTPWRLVIITWAYVWVIAGMWFTISPWRMRDLLNWASATESRVRTLSLIRTLFGVFVICLGVTVYKKAEKRDPTYGLAIPPWQQVSGAAPLSLARPAMRSPQLDG